MLKLFAWRGINTICNSYVTCKLFVKSLSECFYRFVSFPIWHKPFNFIELITALFTITSVLFYSPPHFPCQNEEISHLSILLKTVSQHAMLQESMKPSMVLDRTMFNLYCSTTWLDQAQRKIPLTGKVSVRQPPKREERWEEAAWRSTSWRFHCELLSTSPMHKGVGVQGVNAYFATIAKNTLEQTVSA